MLNISHSYPPGSVGERIVDALTWIDTNHQSVMNLVPERHVPVETHVFMGMAMGLHGTDPKSELQILGALAFAQQGFYTVVLAEDADKIEKRMKEGG